MKTAIYIVKLIPENEVNGSLHATVYRHKKNAMTAYESYSKLLFSGNLKTDEVQFLKYTFMGTPQTVVAKALEVGSVLSRGEYITSDPFCDGDWDVELLQTTGDEVAST
jgi:hypothetical protein